jgi:hypothetical protein
LFFLYKQSIIPFYFPLTQQTIKKLKKKMYQKLFILATIALTAVNAHPGSHAIVNAAAAAPASTFKFSGTFPAPDTIPTAKPEWLELIKNVNVTKAPVYKPAPGLGR